MGEGTGRRAAPDGVARPAGLEQRLVDGEVSATRRRLVRLARRWGDGGRLGLLDPEFLAVADLPTVLTAVVDAAAVLGRADACDVQLLDDRTAGLRIVASRGFRPAFLTHFATVRPGQPTACALAAARLGPVVVPDVTTSGLFAGTAALAVLRDAGTRAVRSHPLVTRGGVLLGVLSFHYRRPITDRAGALDLPALVARQSAEALTRVDDAVW